MALTLLARSYHFVRGDGSLTLAVAILAVFMFALYPMIELGTIPPWSLDLAFGVFMVVGATRRRSCWARCSSPARRATAASTCTGSSARAAPSCCSGWSSRKPTG